ncbi:hypothetical protein [Nocardiopsis halophila]|uniref:hypothetical protein n=1 Tax=Nocardiopsis halophila TaxID=141692 RepID=UPI00034584C7|nr:hypothetical protein [Nocardiopsis halophila]
MCTTRRAQGAVLLAGVVALASAACTPEGPEPPDPSPSPLPTAFGGERPPGVEGDPVRHLHGSGSDGPDILDDDMGVRIQGVGGSFLISSNSEERHLLQRASDGETLWQGGERVVGFTRAPDGGPALRLASAEGDGASVIDDEGATVWEGGGRDVYVPGFSVRRPEGWTPEEPYGEFTVTGPEGDGPRWEYAFEAPPGEQEEGAGPPDSDVGRLGVPVGADEGVLLLDDGAGLLQARDPGDPDEPLWSTAGDASGLLGDGAVPRPVPQIIGHYRLPEPDGLDDPDASEDAEDTEETEGTEGGTEDGDGDGAAPSAPEDTEGADAEEDAEEDTVPAVLVRWIRPEEPSLLSMHDLHTGEVAWTLSEPGTNPADPGFSPDPVAGTVHDSETGTLLLPQAGGATPMMAVDTATGERLWEFEGEEERALAPAFAAQGFVYGDARGADDTDSAQVVLEARTKDAVAEGMDAYVEAVSADGYAVVVYDRQRFVFPPSGGG